MRQAPWRSCHGETRGLPRKGRSELAGERVVTLEPPHDRGPVAAHLLRLLDRHAHLRLERGRAAVPEELLAPGEVPERRRVAPQGRARERERAPPPVRERPVGIVAAGAGAIASARQAHVREQPRTQGDLVRGERVVRRRRGRRGGPLEHLPPRGRDVGALRIRRRSGHAAMSSSASRPAMPEVARMRGMRSHPMRSVSRSKKASSAVIPGLVPGIQPSECAQGWSACRRPSASATAPPACRARSPGARRARRSPSTRHAPGTAA